MPSRIEPRPEALVGPGPTKRGVVASQEARRAVSSWPVSEAYEVSPDDSAGVAEAFRRAAAGGTARAYQMDVTDKESIQAGVDAIAKKEKFVNFLVNNAGVTSGRSSRIPFFIASVY